MLDKKIIPIVLLHHDQADVLLRAVKLIHERTIYPFCIFIIDNNSPDSEDLRYTFQILEAEFQAQIIRNSKNTGFMDLIWPLIILRGHNLNFMLSLMQIFMCPYPSMVSAG
ncbi:hypothetical protein [Polynucleobacter necessarius]|uniref:hypothetical protein n=1 Tax=Polynucleobacter necessarius TaxID=576610 RepID=UPI000E092A58|nr:hypothetical protein [Polynucleobacter necessarius]